MLIAEIGLNHLGNVAKLNDFLGLVGSVDAITVQVIADEFYNNEKYRSLKILDSDLITLPPKLCHSPSVILGKSKPLSPHLLKLLYEYLLGLGV